MNPIDRAALKNFDPSKNQYLVVRGDRRGKHLEVKKLNAWNRIAIFLGFIPNPSLDVVANYVLKNLKKFEHSSEEDKQLLQVLKRKFKRFELKRADTISYKETLKKVKVEKARKAIKKIINNDKPVPYVPSAKTVQKKKLDEFQNKIDEADRTGNYYGLFGLKSEEFQASNFIVNAHQMFEELNTKHYPDFPDLAKKIAEELNNVAKLFMNRFDLDAVAEALDKNELFSEEALKNPKTLDKEAHRMLHITHPKHNRPKDQKKAAIVHKEIQNKYDELKEAFKTKEDLL